MKKSHRVAHENQRRGGFCYYHYTTFIASVKIPFCKNRALSRRNYSYLIDKYILCHFLRMITKIIHHPL